VPVARQMRFDGSLQLSSTLCAFILSLFADILVWRASALQSPFSVLPGDADRA